MDEPPEAKAADILTDPEIDQILDLMTAIATRDHDAIRKQGTLIPDRWEYFWDAIDAYGRQVFDRPRRRDVEQASVIAFSDGRGFAVDVGLWVEGARADLPSGPYVSFEVLGGSGRGVCLHYAFW